MRTLTKFEIMEVSGASRNNTDEEPEEGEEDPFPEDNDDGEDIEVMEDAIELDLEIETGENWEVEWDEEEEEFVAREVA